jgi:hypothetical protein
MGTILSIFSDPDSMGFVDPETGRQKTHKNVKKFFYFDVLDVLFG